MRKCLNIRSDLWLDFLCEDLRLHHYRVFHIFALTYEDWLI